MLSEIVGWYGAVAILAAYALLTTRRLSANATSYQWLNFTGSVGLIVNAAWNGAFPSVFLNFIWLAITAYAFLRPAART
jgi:hypothetical protein